MTNQTVICTYRVKPEAEEQFLTLLAKHWHTLHDLGFVTDEEALVFRRLDSAPTYVEIFTWVAGGFELAHEHPDVVAIWEPMDPLLEDRDGQSKWEFPHFERIPVGRHLGR